jgi:hypothetical protein
MSAYSRISTNTSEYIHIHPHTSAYIWQDLQWVLRIPICHICPSDGVSCRYPTGRARSTRTSCPSTPSATMFSAAAASPPPPSPSYPLPLPPTPTPSHPPFTGTVLCHLAVRRCWAARAPLRRRCGPVRAAPGGPGPGSAE